MSKAVYNFVGGFFSRMKMTIILLPAVAFYSIGSWPVPIFQESLLGKALLPFAPTSIAVRMCDATEDAMKYNCRAHKNVSAKK